MRKTIIAVIVMVAALVSSVGAREYKLRVDEDELYYGVVRRENKGWDVNAVGDRHLRNKAYGLLQIRAPYLKDVNKIAGKDVMAVWGKSKLTMADMKDPAKAEWAFHVYLWHYGNYYTKVTGNIPTAKTYARIHNGGPTGWKDRHTINYAAAVMAHIIEYRIMRA